MVETGQDAHWLKPGDRVLAAGGSGCGRCTACLTGKSRCPHTQVFGLAPTLNGGQAEFVNVPNPSRTLLPIPDGVSDEQALLMTDAMATASFGINNADIRQSGTVAVVGLGPIGVIGFELALLKGASKVYAIDPVAERRAHAEKLGAVALPPGKETIGLIREQTRGGVHSVFEASSAKPAVESTLRLVRRRGTISMIGLPQADVSVSLMPVLFNNVTLRAGFAPVSDMWGGLIPLLQHGRLKAAGLFSHHMGLEEGREAYQLFDARDDGVVKIMMQIS